MENGDADLSIWEHIGVPHVGGEPTLGRGLRVILGEGQNCIEKAALVESVRRAKYGDSPLKQVAARDRQREEGMSTRQ